MELRSPGREPGSPPPASGSYDRASAEAGNSRSHGEGVPPAAPGAVAGGAGGSHGASAGSARMSAQGSARKGKRGAGPLSMQAPEDRRPRKRREACLGGGASADSTGATSAAPAAATGSSAAAAAGSGLAPTPARDAVAAVAAACVAAGAATSGAAAEAEEEPGDEQARELQRLQKELAGLREQYANQKKRLNACQGDRAVTRKALATLLVRVAKAEDAAERDKAASTKYRLGVCKHVAPGQASWEGGYEAEALTRLKEKIKEDRQFVERNRRQITKRERAREKAGDGKEISAAKGAGPAEADELWEAREISLSRLSFIGREELAVKERESRLQVERTLYLKRLQRLEAAERSSFRTYPLISEERYQLLNMIGRGGFSEVYRAYDLESHRFCAVKIHELGMAMSDQQRQSYIRRAMREYDIQKSLKHPRVVSLLDCFAISTKAFGMVLELCEGETLDEHMKRHGPIGEREARGIVIQILSGLKYMNINGRKIIHYDLKPGNLFFFCGEVKIADFGLSKVVQESQGGDSIELTSQGAGTYWYLPPECFVDLGQATQPKISNKVDVWSIGVIFFELLFNKRPFGHGQSQEALLRSTMTGLARPFVVEIPTNPKASSDAKDFIRRLLTENRDARPDVLEAFNDPYLRASGRGRPTNSGAAGGAVAGAAGTTGGAGVSAAGTSAGASEGAAAGPGDGAIAGTGAGEGPSEGTSAASGGASNDGASG